MKYTKLEQLNNLIALKPLITLEDHRDIDREIAEVKQSIEQDEAFAEKCRTYMPPAYIPTSDEDETPDNDNPFQGREDDDRVTSQLD